MVSSMFDPHRIRQIVLPTLLTNAIRYTETGTVRVKQTDAAAGAIELRGQRHGAGRSPGAQIPLIFEEEFSWSARRTRCFEGAGMGLTIVQGLVRFFGGTVEVASVVGGHDFHRDDSSHAGRARAFA